MSVNPLYLGIEGFVWPTPGSSGGGGVSTPPPPIVTGDTLFGDPGWVDEILTRIGTALTAAGIVASDLVIVYEGDVGDVMGKPPGNKVLVIAPTRLPVAQRMVAGGGAAHTVFDGEFRVDVLQKNDGDQGFRSYRQLQRAGGLATTAKAVIDVLQLNPLAVEGDDDQVVTPLIEPMRLVSSDFNPRSPQPGWAYCRTVWSVKFRTSFGA